MSLGATYWLPFLVGELTTQQPHTNHSQQQPTCGKQTIYQVGAMNDHVDVTKAGEANSSKASRSNKNPHSGELRLGEAPNSRGAEKSAVMLHDKCQALWNEPAFSDVTMNHT